MSADRLRALMRRGHKGALAVVLLLGLVVLGVAGCGNDLGKEADEGVPIQLGDLKFTVQETRSSIRTSPTTRSTSPASSCRHPPASCTWASS